MTTSPIPDADLGGGGVITPVFSKTAPNLNVGTLIISAASKDAINSTARSAQQQQMTVAALDSALPIVYGQARLGALIANAMVNNAGQWVFWVTWCQGPVDSIVSITLNDLPLPAGITVTSYLGAAGQGVDPTLAATFAQVLPVGAPTFAETCPGVCYSVITATPGVLSGAPKFNALVKGQHLYDPRQDSTNGGSGSQRLNTPSTWTWSNNPALVLADFLSSSVYGANQTPVWSTVISAANDCDATMGNGEKKRLCDLALDKEQSTANWLEALRTAASCWLVPQGGTVKLVSDVSTASSFTYDHASGNVLAVQRETVQAASQLPTVMEIVYTDTTQLPYRDLMVTASRPGVSSGVTPYRKSSVRMPWITRPTQANREAIERLNKLWLRAITMDVQVMDEGLQQEPGDVVTLNWPDSGYSGYKLRVIKSVPTADGWTLSCTREDPGVYSTTVQAGSTITNTTLPSPTAPPVLTGLTVTEDVYLVQSGRYGSRLDLSWSLPDWPFVAGYQVTITQAGVVKDSAICGALSYVSHPLTEGLLYNVAVSIIATTGAIGTAAQASITTQGKTWPPSDLPSLVCYEQNGTVFFQWSLPSDPDLTAVELRYGPQGTSSWATSTLIALVPTPATTYSTGVIPPGTYTFYAKAHDSLRTATYPTGNQSVNATTYNLQVLGNPDLFLAGSYAFSSPTLTHATAELAETGQTEYMTDYGNTWSAMFPSAMSTYTNPLLTYSGSGTSTVLTESFDLGQSYSGNALATLTYQDISGTAVTYIEGSPDNSTWTQYSGLSVKVTARYLRVRIQTTGFMVVLTLGTIQLAVAAISETGSITTSATAWTTISLSRQYAKVKTIQLTADSTGGQRNPGYTNIVLAANPSTFQVACWDGVNAQVAATVQYLFQGI